MEELDINRREIIRYLGYKKVDDVDTKMISIIEDCISDVMSVYEPKSIYKEFPIERNGDNIHIAGINIVSHSLAKNLKGACKAILFAATIGVGFDRLLKRAEVRDVARSYVLQCVGAEVIEAYCNKINEEIRAKYEALGYYLRPRFSPGYGDFSLEVQIEFERVLKMSKNIGISLSDGKVMSPTKSVTAVIGISDTKTDEDIDGNDHRCDICNMSDSCTFRH